MAGLLDFFQQDPDKQAALKQGLLNMGIQMLAGGRQELGTSLGQGLGAGVSVYQKQIDDMKKKQAMQNVFRSAYGQPPAQAPAVMKPQEAAAPSAQMYGGKAPLLSMDYANGRDLAQSQPQAQPQQEQAPAPAPQEPAPQFDREAFLRASFENPDAGYTDTALKYMLDPSLNKGPESMFGKIMPNAYTPASLAKYQQSNNFADLVPVAGGSNFGNVNPGQFTPESLARYSQSGNYADLVARNAPQKIDSGSSVDIVDPSSGRVLSSTQKQLAPQDQPSIIAAQEKARQEAKAAVDAKTERDKAGPANEKAIASLDRLDSDIESVINHPGLKYAVGAYSVAPVVPGTVQADAIAAIQNLADRAAVGAISEMRAASKTGGAVGAVSEKEWPKLEAQMANLNRSQTIEQFVNELRKFQNMVRESRRLINEAGKQAPATSHSTQTQPAPAQTALQTPPKQSSKADSYNEYVKAYGRATTKAQRDAINARARELGVIK